MKPTIKDAQKLEKMFDAGNFTEASEFKKKFDWKTKITGEKGAYGLVNCFGEQIAPNAFDAFEFIEEEYHLKDTRIVAQKNGKWGVLIADGSGQWLLEPEYDWVSYPHDIVTVDKDGMSWVLDLSTKELIVKTHMHGNGLFTYVNGVAVYKVGDKLGLVNEHGTGTRPIFNDVDFTDAEVTVLYNGKWGYADKNGNFTEDLDEAYFWSSL